MRTTPRNRAAVAALLAVATAVAVAAVVALTTRHGSHPHRSAAAAPAVSAPSTASTPKPATHTQSPLEPVGKVTEQKPRVVTYVVRPGDNLTVIADWFKLHGYGDLYARNRAVIGADPDLIRPGQHIVVTPTGATVGD